MMVLALWPSSRTQVDGASLWIRAIAKRPSCHEQRLQRQPGFEQCEQQISVLS
jgi:hypothetical protein